MNMKKSLLYVGSLLIFVISAFSVSGMAFAKSPLQGGADSETDSNPSGLPEVNIPDTYNPLVQGITTPTPRGTAVYFTPQDENTSTTILFIYNTNIKDALIGLQTFYINGATTIDTTLTIPANSMVRICSDTVTTISASWSNYALINFTTFSAYGKLTLPAGVKADGYIAYNTTGIYDPLTDANIIPLRFSVRTPTVP